MKEYYANYILIKAKPSDVHSNFIKNGVLIYDERTGKILNVVKKNNNNENNNFAANSFKTLIVPGFINAHTHTELTFKPNTETPRIFSEWVISLIEKRKSFKPEERIELRLKAFKEFIESGVTTIGDIVEPVSFYDLSEIKSKTQTVPRVKGFFEIRGLDPSYAAEKIKDFQGFFKNNEAVFIKNDGYFSQGISPHSIYSVSESLFKEILKANAQLNLKTAIHAAEHLSESKFISGGGGDIAEKLLPALGLSKFSTPRKTFSTPIAYLRYLEILNTNVSLIHANEITDEDIDIIKETKADVVHCPRSNAFFNSRTLPLKKLLEKGISVSLGTDSLYSNESLNFLDEIKCSRKIHPDVSSKDIFFMATEGGAKAICFDGVTGTLEPGSYADFIVFKVEKNRILDGNNIYDAVISMEKADIMGVAIGGGIVYNNFN